MYCLSLASKADFPAICELWKESVLATHDFLRVEDFACLEQDIPTVYLPAMDEIWLCAFHDTLAGFLGCAGARVEMLFVSPRFMRQGIGSLLLAHAARLHGPLLLDVNEANEKALAFYLARGFTVIGRCEHDGQGRPYPLLKLGQCQRQNASRPAGAR